MRALLALAACLLLLVAGVAGASTVGTATSPGDASVEAGFARDMQVHHARAVGMAMTIRDRSTDPTIRALAYDIALTQQEQIGQMHGWLTQWELPQTGHQPAMAWMRHRTDPATRDAATMPGMATSAQLRRLQVLRGGQAEVLFLTLMVRHHRGGITMANAALVSTDRPEVRGLARTMVTGQTREITQMQRLLEERRAPRA